MANALEKPLNEIPSTKSAERSDALHEARAQRAHEMKLITGGLAETEEQVVGRTLADVRARLGLPNEQAALASRKRVTVPVADMESVRATIRAEEARRRAAEGPTVEVGEASVRPEELESQEETDARLALAARRRAAIAAQGPLELGPLETPFVRTEEEVDAGFASIQQSPTAEVQPPQTQPRRVRLADAFGRAMKKDSFKDSLNKSA